MQIKKCALHVLHPLFAAAILLTASSVFSQSEKKGIAADSSGTEKRKEEDRSEKDKTTALIKSAFERSKNTPEFKKALKGKENSEMTRILINNGAPPDTTVSVKPGTSEGPAGLITIECCSKKSWGPIIIKI